MVEASPASSLVMPEPDFLLQFLVVAFDAPAQLGQIDQTGECPVVGQGGEPVLGRLLFILRPFDEQPFLGSGLLEPFIAVRGAHSYPCIARGQPIGRTLAPGNHLPGRCGQAEGERLGLDRLMLRVAAGAAGRSAAARPGFRRQRSPCRQATRSCAAECRQHR